MQGRPRISMERAIEAPRVEGPRRAPVALVLRIPGLFLGQIEPHDVAGIAPEEATVRLRSDDVVRRGDDRGEVVDHLRGVPQGTKRVDRRHGRESYDSPRCRPEAGTRRGGRRAT